MKELNWESLLGIDLSPEDIEILNRKRNIKLWKQAFYDKYKNEIHREAIRMLLDDDSGDSVTFLEPFIKELIDAEINRDKSRDD